MHFCIGAPLARLEIAVSLAQLRSLAPRLRLVTEPEYQPFFVIRGLTGLVVSASSTASPPTRADGNAHGASPGPRIS
jgi:cytochrome P450